MSRAEREAWEAEQAANPALRTAMDAFKAQVDRLAATARPGTVWDQNAVDEAVAAITDAQQAVRAVYLAAGLDPDRADAAPDDE